MGMPRPSYWTTSSVTAAAFASLPLARSRSRRMHSTSVSKYRYKAAKKGGKRYVARHQKSFIAPFAAQTVDQTWFAPNGRGGSRACALQGELPTRRLNYHAASWWRSGRSTPLFCLLPEWSETLSASIEYGEDGGKTWRTRDKGVSNNPDVPAEKQMCRIGALRCYLLHEAKRLFIFALEY